MGGSKVTTKFRVSPVMTTSISLRIKFWFGILIENCRPTSEKSALKIPKKWSVSRLRGEDLVTSPSRFRVSPAMSCCGAQNLLLALRFAKFWPLPLLMPRFFCRRQRSATSPLRYPSVSDFWGCFARQVAVKSASSPVSALGILPQWSEKVNSSRHFIELQ